MKYVAVIFLSISILLTAQQQDTAKVKLPADSLAAANDTSKAVRASKKKFDVDAVVNASSKDSLVYDVANKKMFLFGSAELKYKDTDLTSGKIFVDYETNELEAFGIEDTSDTAKVKLKQTPVLHEGGETYEGSRIRYNFKNQRGFISLAKNKSEDSRYEGEKVKKVDKSTYFIEGGMFTTCEEDTPHTYFAAHQMKVIQRDKIIANWIFIYIGGVPFPVPLPFAVIPNESGRRSGIIIPTYGDAANRGQYFRNFGYFFALSDYFDLTLTADYYTKGGYGLRSRTRYAKRYDFSGSINAGYSKLYTGEAADPGRTDQIDWNINIYHNQQINPTARLDLNLQFISSNFLRNNSIDYNDILNQDIVSNANFNKQWDQSGSSISINYSRTQKLSTGDIYETLPSISFSKNITYPFRREDSESISGQKWYELIGFTYSGLFRNDRKKVKGNLAIRGGIQHNLSTSFSPKIGYFSVSPRIAYTEKWYSKRIKLENEKRTRINPQTNLPEEYDTIVTKDVNELNAVRTFDMSISASTKLYGIFQPNILGIEAFRHTITPAITYNFKPDFSKESWGYFDTYITPDGKKIRYDKFGKEIYGGSGAGENQHISFSIGNVFEIKTAKDPRDTTKNSESNKIQLLNLDANIGYNFAADSLRLSELRVGYRTQIGNLLSFYGSSIFTFYDYVLIDPASGTYRQVNRFLIDQGKGLFRLTNFAFSVSTNLAGEKSEDKRSVQKAEDFDAFKKKDYITTYDETQSPDFSIPWNLSLSYNFNLIKTNPNKAEKYSNLSANLSFSLTNNWKFTVRGSYDFELKQISAPQITVYRDLHCWELNFSWNPIGFYRGYRFEIRMKAPELQDIKVTKSKGIYSGRR